MSAQDKNTTPGASSMTPPIRMVSVPVDGQEVTITLTGKVSDTMPSRPGWFRVTGHNFIFSATGQDADISLTAAPVREEGGAGPTNEQIQSVMLDAVKEVRATLTDSTEIACMDADIARMESGPVDMGETGWAVMRSVHRRLAALATREEAPELALEDAKVFGVGFIVDGQRVSPDRVTVCRGEEAPAEAGAALGRLSALLSASHLAGDAAVAGLGAVSWNDLRAVLDVALRAHPQAREEAQPVLTVWYGSMPESNGRQNWTATLRRVNPTDKWDQGFCFARSEYPERVRYEADRMRWIIGELAEKPDILAYDEKAHSGYVAPTPPAPEAEKLRVAVEALELAAIRFDEIYEAAEVDDIAYRNEATIHGINGNADVAQAEVRQALAALQQEGR